MFEFIQKYVRNIFSPNSGGTTGHSKRLREESDEEDSGELAKRLCMMTETRMAAKHSTQTSDWLRHPADGRTQRGRPTQGLEQWPDLNPGRSGASDPVDPLATAATPRRICYPRKPSKVAEPCGLTAEPFGKDTVDRAILGERNRPIVLEDSSPPTKDTKPTSNPWRLEQHRHADSARSASRRRWWDPAALTSNDASDAAYVAAKNDGALWNTDGERAGKGMRARKPAGGTAAEVVVKQDDDLIVLTNRKSSVPVKPKGLSDFRGLQSFRQMLERGRVTSRATSAAAKPSPRKPRGAAVHRNLLDKLLRITPNKMLSSRRGLSTYNCFRLDEKRRYQALLSQMGGSGAAADTSLLNVSTSYRTKSALAASPQGETAAAALQRGALSFAATESLTRRIILSGDLSATFSCTGDGSGTAAIGGASVAAPKSHTDAETRQPNHGDSSDDDVIIERVVVSPPRPPTELELSMRRTLQRLDDSRQLHALSAQHRQQQLRAEQLRRQLAAADDALWQRALTDRMRRQLRVTPRAALEAEPELSSEEEEEEELLPELTSEMEAKISAALRPSPATEVVADAFNQRITRRDLQTLKGLNWLNDEVINFYMNMLMDRSKNDERLPKLYCFNTFFYGKIISQGQQSVRRWTRKVDIFAQDLLMIPVHLGMHWCLACVDLRAQTVRYLDSMGGNNNKGLDAILRYLRDEHADKKKAPLDTSDWRAVNEKEIPQQMNGSDCGMFCCKFADYLSRGAAVTFTQQDMPYFRRRMVYEIVTKKLLQ